MTERIGEGALGDLRVLDLATEGAAYCGKLLADLGADVVKIEPPGGDAGRRRDESGRLAFAYANGNKRSIVLDLDVEADRERLRALAATADLVLESQADGFLEARDLAWSDLSRPNPGLVLTSITGFGRTGPQRGFRSNDLVASALGGAMISIGDPADPPVRLASHQADVITATLAAGSSLVALAHRDRTGLGQHVDVSSLEAMAAITHIAGVGKWLEDDVVPKRVGTGLVASVPSGAYRCKDGLVYLMVNRPAHWEALAKWIHERTGNEEVLLPDFRGPSSNRLPFRELLDVFIGDLTEQLTVAEAYHEGQRRHIAFTPVNTAARILADEHLAARAFFEELELEDGRRVRVPGAPYRLSHTPWRIARPVPKADADRRAVLEELEPGPLAARRTSIAAVDARRSAGARASAPTGAVGPASSPASPGLGLAALAGLRVVEFGTGLAAPWIGRILAWAGADVIKIESHAHPDVPRLFVAPRHPEQGTQPECSPWFTDWSAGKRFVALDLRKPEGAELARRIVDRSDAVIANYSTGVLDKLGVGYAALSARNPGLVMLESNGYGESGPFAKYVTWGPNIEALSGLGSFSGFPHRECTISHFAYPDPLSALHGLVALMAGLRERGRSGRGQVIHMSQFETAVAAIGPLLLESALTGQEPPRLGNGERDRAPYGCFPCRGDDRWCVIGVEDEADWRRLCAEMGEPAWTHDARFATMAARVVHAAELEAKIADWTREQDDYAVMERCQRAGLAAGVVQSAEDLYRRDPQLAARNFFETIPHFKRGTVHASGIPLGLTATPGRTPFSGSSIGHDNEAVLREVAGLTQTEWQEGLRSGAIEARR
ncbi:MAG: CoA transferase [Deltaproteobacteria bacterium]|nr:CoA transferase [Deltaproteobacteria bacterium]